MKSLVEAVCPRLASAEFLSVDVEREDRTDSNKSIDLVIVGDALLVGIENKIYAGLYNPFAEYRKRLEDIANEKEISRENVLMILLSLNPQKSTEGLHGFTPVTYDEFFSVLLRNIGQKTL